MLILHRDNSLVLVRQPDHAALAGAIARAWRRPEAVPASVWDRFLVAVDHHDDGWIAAEAKPALDDDGRPCDFKQLPTDQHLAIWRRGLDLANRDDPYVSLLVAHHARHLYTHSDLGRDDNPAAAQAFINELNIRIVRCVEPLQLGDADEQAAIHPRCVNVVRRLLTCFDGLSLALLGALQLPDATDLVAFADVESPLSLQLTPPDAVVDPWPFDAPELSLRVPATEVPDQAYASPAALARAIAVAPARALTVTLRPKHAAKKSL